MALNGYRDGGPTAPIKIVVPRLPRISNFDDLDPLRAEPDVRVELVEPGHPLPADADLILLPGSKSTIGDLQASARSRLGHRHQGACRGAAGACSGCAAATRCWARGSTIPTARKGRPGAVDGLGLLQVETRARRRQGAARVTGRDRRAVKPFAATRCISAGPAARIARGRCWISRAAGRRGVGGRPHHGQLCARHLRRRRFPPRFPQRAAARPDDVPMPTTRWSTRCSTSSPITWRAISTRRILDLASRTAR